jgi:hypothetical protein
MQADLIDFIRSYREPVHISVAADELAMLSKAGAGWPNASATHWQRELEQLVASGKLLECNGLLSVPKTETVKQRTLFD